MNYLAEGLQGGFAIGAAGREKKRDREERERLEKARRDLELERDATRYKSERELQNERLVADAKKQFSQQGFTAGEADKDRGFRSGESQKEREARIGLQTGAQGFQGTQAELERAARAAALDKDLAQRKTQFDAELPLKGAQVGIQSRAQEWNESPNNPYNVLRDEQGRAIRLNNEPLTPATGAAADAPGNVPELPILSPEQARAQPPGTRYRTIDGRIMVR